MMDMEIAWYLGEIISAPSAWTLQKKVLLKEVSRIGVSW